MSAEFNEEQKKAITHKDGPAMVLAGPGFRENAGDHIPCQMAHRAGGDTSFAIFLVITFTRAAAREMQQRFKKLMESEQTCR